MTIIGGRIHSLPWRDLTTASKIIERLRGSFSMAAVDAVNCTLSRPQCLTLVSHHRPLAALLGTPSIDPQASPSVLPNYQRKAERVVPAELPRPSVLRTSKLSRQWPRRRAALAGPVALLLSSPSAMVAPVIEMGGECASAGNRSMRLRRLLRAAA